MKDTKISEHLTVSEMCYSATGTKLKIENIPNKDQIENMKVWAENIFEPIREHFGVPIFVISGFRCLVLNKAVGGSSTSEHCTGSAGDLDQDGQDHGVSNKEVFEFIRDNLNFNQLIWEFGNKSNADWVHVSFNCKPNAKQKKQVLRASKVKGKTVYTAM